MTWKEILFDAAIIAVVAAFFGFMDFWLRRLIKKKRSLEDKLLEQIYQTYPISRSDIWNIYQCCGRSYDRTINIIEYKIEYNLSTESAINLLI